MDVRVLSATKDGFSVLFKDGTSGQQVVIGLSGDIINQWKMQTSQLMPTITQLADEIILNHDYSKPFQSEYIFSSQNSQPTLSATIDYIRQNPL